jgi:hypothetical protein
VLLPLDGKNIPGPGGERVPDPGRARIEYCIDPGPGPDPGQYKTL